jgi:rhamnosyltransferase
MRALSSTTAAIVVVYRLDSNPGVLVGSLHGHVALTVLADNSEAGHPALPSIPDRHDLLKLHPRNRGGLAGAYNQALALIRLRHPHITHVVFLDEDSDASVLPAFLSDPDVTRLLTDPASAAVSPAYVDRATGLRGRYIELERFRLHYLPRVFAGLKRVAFVINSMSVWQVQALQRIGEFNQGLAIDHVDTEYCLRARQLGLSLHVHGGHEFEHSIGQRRRFMLFGREMQAGGHPPARRYLIGRNTAWLGRHYLWREPAFAFLCVSRLAYEAVGIAVAEDGRLAKLWALLKGAGVGLLTRRMQ